MKPIYIFLLTAFVFVGCNDTCEEKPATIACGVADPIKNLPWIRERIEKSEQETCTIFAVYSARYKNRDVILIRITGPLCDTCAGEAVYNCEGEGVYFCDPEEDKNLTNKKLIWERQQA